MTTVAWAFTLLLAAADPARPPLPYFGLDFRWMPGTAQQKFLHVERVVPDGPAARAGLRPGDQITHIGGVPVDFGDELDFLIFIRAAGRGDAGHVTRSWRAAWEQGFRVAQQRRLAARGGK